MIIPNVVVHHLWISVPCVAFVPEIGTVQTWIMMHRICVCLHTDSMRSVIECRGDWLQLSHLEVESIEENCMSVKCSEPSWLCTKMWISIVFYSSCEFKQWILAVVWTIAFDSYWIPGSLNRMQKKLFWLLYVIARRRGRWLFRTLLSITSEYPCLVWLSTWDRYCANVNHDAPNLRVSTHRFNEIGYWLSRWLATIVSSGSREYRGELHECEVQWAKLIMHKNVNFHCLLFIMRVQTMDSRGCLNDFIWLILNT